MMEIKNRKYERIVGERLQIKKEGYRKKSCMRMYLCLYVRKLSREEKQRMKEKDNYLYIFIYFIVYACGCTKVPFSKTLTDIL